MNNLLYNFKGYNKTEYCPCETEMTNNHLYECEMLNSDDRKIPYEKIFEGRLCEMQYIINVLIRNHNKLEHFTLAQNFEPLVASITLLLAREYTLYNVLPYLMCSAIGLKKIKL